MVYIKAIKNNQEWYATYSGMTKELIFKLISDLGCTNIQEISQDEFNKAKKEV